MLENAYLLAKIGADTAEIELHFAQIAEVKSSLKSSFEALDERLNAPEGREEVPR